MAVWVQLMLFLPSEFFPLLPFLDADDVGFVVDDDDGVGASMEFLAISAMAIGPYYKRRNNGLVVSVVVAIFHVPPTFWQSMAVRTLLKAMEWHLWEKD